jgi:wyosine [tRNA(Phe)-imidazoG37] synthetase (radical SAM superfamily)
MKKFHYLYGPVPSRRLGRSLGIDLVPHKVCTYNCIYCQIGGSTQQTLVRKEYVPVSEVLKEVEIFLREESESVDYLSLGGSGEPTLHSGIGKIIEGIKTMTSIPVAVLTNGALLYEKEVREDLLKADVLLPSMDAVSPEVFEKINRPYAALSIGRIIEGLVEFKKIFKGKIWFEILFCKGVNDSPEELNRLKEVVKKIQPDLIHLNTVVRPPSENWAIPLSKEEMEKIQAFFGKKAVIISEFTRHPLRGAERDLKEEILNILRRRPLSLNDLSKGMNLSGDDLKKHVDSLVEEGKVHIRSFGESIYYEVGKKVRIS